MKRKALILGFMFCFALKLACADGKFFHNGRAPWIPYQRALILFDGKEEILFLESTYEHQKGAMGWVVPLPTVPEFATMNAFAADALYSQLASMSKINEIDLSAVKYFIFLGFWISVLVLIIKYTSRTLGCILSMVIVILTLAVGFLILPFGMKPTGVHLIKEEKVGIYNVKVIQSENGDEVVAWLNEQHFQFNEKDAKVFDHYAKQNWCFVVAQIPNSPRTINSERKSAPLIAKFETKRAVYPLALTGSSQQDTQVDLFVVSSRKINCKERLRLDFAGPPQNSLIDIVRKEVSSPSFLESFQLSGSEFLTSFSKLLSPSEMANDLYFEYAQDNRHYRRREIIW